MTTFREPVVAFGVLRGAGQHRECQVRVIKLSPAPPAKPAYTRPDLIDVDDDFPDGDYELIVGEQTFRLVKQGGRYDWLVRTLELWRITGIDFVGGNDPVG